MKRTRTQQSAYIRKTDTYKPSSNTYSACIRYIKGQLEAIIYITRAMAQKKSKKSKNKSNNKTSTIKPSAPSKEEIVAAIEEEVWIQSHPAWGNGNTDVYLILRHRLRAKTWFYRPFWRQRKWEIDSVIQDAVLEMQMIDPEFKFLFESRVVEHAVLQRRNGYYKGPFFINFLPCDERYEGLQIRTRLKNAAFKRNGRLIRDGMHKKADQVLLSVRYVSHNAFNSSSRLFYEYCLMNFKFRES